VTSLAAQVKTLQTATPIPSGQQFTGYCTGLVPSATTISLPPFGTVGATTCTNATTLTNELEMDKGGTISQFRCKAHTAGTNASSGACTLYVNGSPTALTCTIGTGTSCSDTTDTVSVPDGGTIGIRVTTQTSDTLASLRGTFYLQYVTPDTGAGGVGGGCLDCGVGTTQLSPTTTIAALTASNTSSCPSSGTLPPGCTALFLGLTDHCGKVGNQAATNWGGTATGVCDNNAAHTFGSGTNGSTSNGPATTSASSSIQTTTTVPVAGSVSRVSPLKLLYPGFTGTITTKITCATVPWWHNLSPSNSSGHIDIGQDQENSSMVSRQVQAMIAAGCNVIVGDNYGQGSVEDVVMLLFQAYADGLCANGTCPIYIALREDHGTHTVINSASAWSSGTAYKTYSSSHTSYDSVTSGGNTYVAIANSTNQDPASNPNSWLQVDASSSELRKMQVDINYYYRNYMTGHASYWKVLTGGNTRPILEFYGSFSSGDWSPLKTWIHADLNNNAGITGSNEPLLAPDASPRSRCTDANLDGCFNWVGVDAFDNTSQGAFTVRGLSGTGQFNPRIVNTGASYNVDDFISTVAGSAKPVIMASVYKGFDDSNASWGWSASTLGEARKMAQQCGTVWVNTWGHITSTGSFSSANQIFGVQETTWNDYEEGTALENGISNCYTIGTPSINAGVVSWTLTDTSGGYASTSTIDSFSLYLADASGNAQDILDGISNAATSVTIPSGLPSGTWNLYVYANGVSQVINVISPAASYVVP
jgi:hypothetical protein